MTQVSSKNILSFKGNLSFEIINDLLNSAQIKLDALNLDLVTKKRLYSILVECLENSEKHKAEIFNGNYCPLEMEIYKSTDGFVIRVGNYIKKTGADALIKKIEEVNALNRDGLNQMYRSSIAKARISDKGGAGLGIIDIARNSGQKIKYDFLDEGKEIQFFKMEISLLTYTN